jgi:crossover junction endodeoxyribonuclease RuvC
MRIVGIDPALQATGYGVIEIDELGGSRMKVLEFGSVHPPTRGTLPQKIERIYQNLQDILSQYRPTVMVLEKLYTHYRYPTTAFILGHVRGVICLLCAQQKIELVEHSVKRIRKALVGQGNATKQQTQKVVAHILQIDEQKMTLDASDALALALGYAQMQRFGMTRRPSINVFGEGCSDAQKNRSQE